MSTNREDPRWWLEKEEDGWKRVVRVVRSLDEGQAIAKQRMARAARLYDPNVEITGTQLDITSGPFGAPGERSPVVINIIKSATDTVTSMIAKNQPRAAFMTDNADFTTTQKAKDLERFIEAEFQRTEVYDDAVRMFRDATIMGLGCLRIEDDGEGRPSVERVLPWDIVVDDAEIMAGGPRQMHQLRFVDRDVLKAIFEDKADQITAASGDDKIRAWTSYRQFESDMIPVIESWHLPSEAGADDGVYAVCIDGVTLSWKKWKHSYFPHVFFRWSERLTGFWGCGLSEELAGIQNKINKLIWHMTKCHDLSNSYVLVQAIDAAMRVKASGGPDPLQLLPYRGTAEPKFITPPAVQRELYDHLVFLIQQAYRIAGISELNATSQVPAQLESSIALNTYNDINTQRFSIQAQRYERSIMEVARQMVRLMQVIGRKTEAKWRSGNLIKTIKWSDVDMDDSMYVLTVQAASIQSRLPSGRLDAALQLGNAGLLEKDEIKRLVGHPDLERTMSLANASMDHAEAIIERLSQGKYEAPEVLDNLPVAMKYVSQAFMTMKDKNAPDTILQVFRMWLKAALREIQKQPVMPAQQAAAMAPPPPAPQAGPAPPALELPAGAAA